MISALVGIAVSRELIKSLDQPIADDFPELAKDPERRKREITVEDLLTMRSGLASKGLGWRRRRCRAGVHAGRVYDLVEHQIIPAMSESSGAPSGT